MSVYYNKLGSGQKLIVPKYRPAPPNRLEDIPEKVYSSEVKPIVGVGTCLRTVKPGFSQFLAEWKAVVLYSDSALSDQQNSDC